LYGEKGFEETVSTVASMKEKNSFILSPSIDLAWRFSPDSAVVFREVGQDQPVFDPRTSSDRVVAAFKNDPKNAIWVGRNYGVRQLDPNAYLALDSRFRCRIEIPKEAQRFLILSNSEDCNSKAPFSN